MSKKFAWLPVESYCAPGIRNGSIWLKSYYEINGKAYRSAPQKIRVRLNSRGDAVFILKPEWCNYQPHIQTFECIRLKYAKNLFNFGGILL